VGRSDVASDHRRRRCLIRSPSDSDSDSGRNLRRRARRDRNDTFVDPQTAAGGEKARKHFYRGWLIVATAISILANVAHAWLKAADGIQIGAALVALVPPVFLLVQTHSRFQADKGAPVRVGLRCLASADRWSSGFLRSICAMRRLATWWSCWVRHRIVRVSGRC